MHGKWLPREPSLLLRRSFGRRVLWNVTLKSKRQYPVDLIIKEIVSLAKSRELEVDSIDIDEHSQQLTTEELMQLHCVSQQEIIEESLTKEEEVTAKQQSLAQ
ncbi:hypothetical protein AVEN_142619-1 [Araneus ventricosus]|uniref:Uncharacterized protein n=1 Tax=Araneus ventricosus TaxID=182803 RepID=A0A4Y2G7D2_ARAVE|nr:hypothetical protein AVEN_142619-1 [Araneus ventricosus]